MGTFLRVAGTNATLDHGGVSEAVRLQPESRSSDSCQIIVSGSNL